MSKNNYIETLPNGIQFEMIHIPGGKLMIGSEEHPWEKPSHEVSVPDFYLGKYPVTQQLWRAVMGDDNNPSYYTGDLRPVESISWNQAQEFIQRLNKISRQNYVLPSEAIWEYAARGGQKSQGFRYAGSNKLKEVGWYNLNSHRETKPVGLKQSNELGLYDMSGNVWEWCADHWHESYEGAPVDGSPWVSGGDEARRVVRGGSWLNYDYYCRVSVRYRDLTENRFDDIGFRLARY